MSSSMSAVQIPCPGRYRSQSKEPNPIRSFQVGNDTSARRDIAVHESGSGRWQGEDFESEPFH
jgi:hypothetical protein